MYINGSAVLKTAVLWVALGAVGFYQAGQNNKRQETRKAAYELQKTDAQKCIEQTDDATGLVCASKYGKTHRQQQEAAKLASPPKKD